MAWDAQECNQNAFIFSTKNPTEFLADSDSETHAKVFSWKTHSDAEEKKTPDHLRNVE